MNQMKREVVPLPERSRLEEPLSSRIVQSCATTHPRHKLFRVSPPWRLVSLFMEPPHSVTLSLSHTPSSLYRLTSPLHIPPSPTPQFFSPLHPPWMFFSQIFPLSPPSNPLSFSNPLWSLTLAPFLISISLACKKRRHVSTVLIKKIEHHTWKKWCTYFNLKIYI